jgi:hypothetical protein
MACGTMRAVAPISIFLFVAVIFGCEDDPRTDVPSLAVPRASRAPALDGRPDEAVWQRAGRTERFVDTMDGSESAPETWARLLWDDTSLYIAFEVGDDHLRCTFEGHDAHLWEQDAVEVMIDPEGDGDGLNYFELQLSPTGLVFDTRFDRPRQPPPIGHAGFDSGLRGEAALRGRVNDDEADEGYTAELAIPWSAFRQGHPPIEPPRAGDRWRIALYVLDAQPGGQRGVGWSAPLVPDFHVPERFGRVTFEGP